MQIFVRPTRKGVPIAVQVESTDTIAVLKRKINEAGGTPSNPFYYLAHGENILDDDDKTIDGYEIRNDDEIFLFLLPRLMKRVASIQILVRILGDVTTALDIEPLDTVADVKKKLKKKLGDLPEDCWMSLNGRVLLDHVIISNYYIRDGYTIVVHPAIRGGTQISVKALSH